MTNIVYQEIHVEVFLKLPILNKLSTKGVISAGENRFKEK